MHDAPLIRRAEQADARSIAKRLARAFADDPAFAWLIPDDAKRARLLPGLFKAMVSSAIRHGRVLRTPGNDAVTVWRLPGAIEPSGMDKLRALPSLLPFAMAAGPRAKLLSETLHRHYPKSKFRYLQIAGCDPQYQGKGLGSAVVREGLDRAASARVPVYLETATEANIGYYERFGFAMVGEFDIPEGGPRFWQMLWKPNR